MRLLIILCFTPLATMAEPIVVGPSQVMFDWTTDRCLRWDSPDTPARAWRDQDQIIMLAGAEQTRLSWGPSLEEMHRDCRIVHEGAEVDDPAAFDDRTWITSPYIEESGRLTALAHVEYHGHTRPGACLAAAYSPCWWNSIVELSANPNFTAEPAGASLVAALPIRYTTTQTRRQGYFNPSNIINRDGYLYAFLFAEDAFPQLRGACLIRRPVGGQPESWRAWDGDGFKISFIDPYRDAAVDPTRHVCVPVPGVLSTISSIVRRSGTDIYIAVTPMTSRGSDGIERHGIWWMTSTDLIHWTSPNLLLEVPLLWRRDCETDAAYAYPSLIDPDSPTANFETVDEEFWLYLVRIRLDKTCKTGPQRDLVRFPISWPSRSENGNVR